MVTFPAVPDTPARLLDGRPGWDHLPKGASTLATRSPNLATPAPRGSARRHAPLTAGEVRTLVGEGRADHWHQLEGAVRREDVVHGDRERKREVLRLE